MQVITYKNDQKAIVIPLGEYEKFADDIRGGKDLNSILADILPKAVYEMTPEEMKAHLMPKASQLVQDALNEDLYSSTWIDSPDDEGQFLHTYADGTSELVQVDAKSGEEKILRNRK